MKRKGLARRAVAVGVALSMIFTLSACGKGEQDKSVSKSASNSEAVKTGEGKVLTVWIGKTFNPDADDRLAERFKSFAEVDDRVSEVKVETFPGSEGQVKWNAAIESGNVPDVSFLVAAPYANFSEMGLLEDLSDVIGDIEKNLGSLYPAVKKDMTTSDGSIYGVPLCNASTMLHYRTDLFEKAGIAAPPTSWEEMEEVCEKLSKVCDDGVSPFGHVISASDDSESHNLWILRSFGGRLWDEEGNVAINSPETMEAINYILDLYHAGYIPATTVEWDSSGNNKCYLAEECAMAINPPTLYNSIITGDMKDTLGTRTAISPLPNGEFESWKEPGRNVLSVFKGAPDVELSKDLLRYVFDGEWYKEFMNMNFPVNVPVFEDAMAGDTWQDGDGKLLVEQAELENSSFGYPCSEPAVIRADAYCLFNFVFSKTLLRVIMDGQSVEDAVAQFEGELNTLKADMEAQLEQ